MTDSDPVLADPAAERLIGPADRPVVEFSRSTRVLVYTAVVLGLVLAVGVVWYVIAR